MTHSSPTDTSVEKFLSGLAPERRALVDAIRSLILDAHPELTEHIKWNAPSFVHDGDDRLTLNLHYPGKILLLLHMGATHKENKQGQPVLDEDSGLITWASDIRGSLSFTSVDDVSNKADAVASIIRHWLAIKV